MGYDMERKDDEPITFEEAMKKHKEDLDGDICFRDKGD